MPKVLITGMSGTGKSTALQVLGSRGHRTVDTDSDRWSRWVTLPDGSSDWVWREQAITDLLTGHDQGSLFVAGCKTNQGQFYPLFDHIVLLSAPADVLLVRIVTRTSNSYGKRLEERDAIAWLPSSHGCGRPQPSRSTPPRRSTRSSSSWRNSRDVDIAGLPDSPLRHMP